jgi:hypothetical protein
MQWQSTFGKQIVIVVVVIVLSLPEYVTNGRDDFDRCLGQCT